MFLSGSFLSLFAPIRCNTQYFFSKNPDYAGRSCEDSDETVVTPRQEELPTNAKAPEQLALLRAEIMHFVLQRAAGRNVSSGASVSPGYSVSPGTSVI